jgi:hypothetical protein
MNNTSFSNASYVKRMLEFMVGALQKLNANSIKQGTLAEGEGSVQLTSSFKVD